MNYSTHLLRYLTLAVVVALICLWSIGHELWAKEGKVPGSDNASRLSSSGVDGAEQRDAAYARKVFEKAYGCFERADYEDAAAQFYRFVKAHTPDDDDFEWASFFLGVSLSRMGFSHGSVDLLSGLVKQNPNPKIVAYALEILETVTRTLPFDRRLLIDEAICNGDFGFVDGMMADFVNYYQGLYNWQHGFKTWGDHHFRLITPESYYYHKYLYQKAGYTLKSGDRDGAVAILETILSAGPADGKLGDDARKMLARLFYEKKEFDAAGRLYREIEQSILEQSRTLLELAWVEYREGNQEKAMGMLYAFEAPSFRHSFTPEYYILKSFIYKDVCHYQQALDVVADFRSRYGEALSHIYDRQSPLENHVLMFVLLGRPDIQRTYRFVTLLSKEKEMVSTLHDTVLKTYLNRLYDLKIREVSTLLAAQVKDAYERLAADLLQYEEDTSLMAYEVALDMSQRVRERHGGKPSGVKEENDRGKVVYTFQGEFWNDELMNYRVHLEDKCDQHEEWDIFFK